MRRNILLKEQKRTEKPKNIYTEFLVIITVTICILLILYIIFKKR